jgi:S1-C subfamily serine protease
MRLIAILAAVVLAGCANVGVVVRAHQSTVLLTMEDGTCSGTVIAPHTVLTAEHCLTGTHTLAIDSKPVEVVKVVLDHRDHALVIVSATFSHWSNIAKLSKLSPQDNLGNTVFIIGNPGSLRDMYRKGYVSGVQVIDGKAWTLIDLNGFYGDSGSALFDESGNIVGVISVLYQQTDNGYIKFMGMLPLAFTPDQWRQTR